MKGFMQEMASRLIRTVSELALKADIEQLMELGITPSQANKISMLKISDIANLSRYPNIIDVIIDDGLLKETIQRAQEPDATSEILTEKAELTMSLLRNLSLHASDKTKTAFVRDRFNLTNETAHKLAELDLRSVRTAAATGINFYTIGFIHRNFSTVLEFYLEEKQELDAIDELIRANASFTMASRLTGMQKSEFSRRRKLYNFETTKGGKPEGLTEREENTAYEAWKNNADLPIIYRCLAVHRSLNGVDLRNCWPVLELWLADEKETELTA